MNQSGKYAQIVEVIKKSLIIIKIAPFVFCLAYILCIVAYMFVSDEWLLLIDTLFYTSPMTVIFLLILSRVYHLCGWHRLECCLPLIPIGITLIDRFVIQFSVFIATINVYTIIVMFILSLFNAYKIFFCDGK